MLTGALLVVVINMAHDAQTAASAPRTTGHSHRTPRREPERPFASAHAAFEGRHFDALHRLLS